MNGTTTMRHMVRRGSGVTALGLAALFAAPGAADAQRLDAGLPPVPTPCEEWENPHRPPPERLCQPDLSRSAFNLRGQGDIAYTGMRASSQNVAFWVGNFGMGPWQRVGNPPILKRGTPASPATWVWEVFDIQPYLAAAPSEWRRHRENVPSLENVIGGGYIWETNFYPDMEHFTGRDGAFGVLHSGAQSTSDGSCLDHTGSFVPAGVPLMAGSGCPETWGSAGWIGARHVDQEGWEQLQADLGPDFTFDPWRVPAAYADPTRPFVGTAFQTFGVITGHGREVREIYGSVIPGGAGAPQLEGYPLGIDVRIDAYSFDVPTVAGMVIVQGVLINRSEALYGVPLDYDSVFFGYQTRWLRAPPGSGRRATAHAIVEKGAVVSNELGRRNDCDGLTTPPGVTWISCPALIARTGRGFRVGATGIMWLKSPIGDLRNKKFSDPESPFYDPGHVNAGDTITFNRMSLCGFECGQAQFTGSDRRRGYGILSGNTADALDGRDPEAMTAYDTWMMIKPYNGSDAERCDIANNPRGPGCFNWAVLDPNWRYTNRPAGSPSTGPDTLFFDTCNPTLNECVALWSDTLPDGTGNYAYNNTWSGAGPFPLAAGDSAEFTVAFLAAPDSSSFAALLDNTYGFYQDFYLGPGLPAVVGANTPGGIRAVAQGGIRSLGQPAVRIFLDDAPSQWVDPFTQRLADKIEAGTTGDATIERVFELNPWLVDSLRHYNQGNVSRILVYKSCDNGSTFTADNTPPSGRCRAAPLRDEVGNTVDPGWQAYDELLPTNGVFPAVFRDPFVVPGQSYLYSFVSESPGISFIVWDSIDSNNDGQVDSLDRRTLEILAASRTTLSTNTANPNVVTAYVPISTAAGTRPATARIEEIRGGLWTFPASGPFVRDGQPTGLTSVVVDIVDQSAPAASYRLIFADSAEVRAYGPPGERDSTVVIAHRSAVTGFGAGGVPVRTPYEPLRLRTTADDGVMTQGASGPPSPGDDGSDVTRLAAPVGILVSSGQPIFVSATMTGSGFTPPTIFRHSAFPGFILDATQRSGALLSRDYFDPAGEPLGTAIRPTVLFQGTSTATGAAYGEYLMRWSDDPYGATAPHTLVRTDRDGTRQRIAAAIQGRQDATQSVTSAAAAEALSAALGSEVNTDDLAALSFPFTMENASFGRQVQLAVLRSDVPDQILLGSGADSVWVPVPSGVWVPGTPVYLLEQVAVASTDGDGEVVIGAGGEPTTIQELRVTFAPARIGCTGDQPSCNPIRGPGTSGGYVRARPDHVLATRFGIPLRSGVEVAFSLDPAVLGGPDVAITEASLESVRVVPNPYVVASAYELEGRVSRIAFTGLPAQGTITVFTAAGQFVQRLRWTESDLSGNGDMFWNMLTHEGTDLAPGFYLFSVEATDPTSGATRRKLGKFIVIR